MTSLPGQQYWCHRQDNTGVSNTFKNLVALDGGQQPEKIHTYAYLI